VEISGENSEKYILNFGKKIYLIKKGLTKV